MTNYAGMDPRSALAAWYAQRNPADPNTLDMTDLARQNPAAWQLLKTGQNTNDPHTRQIFNPNTGGWDDQQKHGWFSHPESWLQLGLGGAMGGLGIAGALGNTAAPIIGTGFETVGPALPEGFAAGGAAAGGATSAALGTGAAASLYGPLKDAYGEATPDMPSPPASLDPSQAWDPSMIPGGGGSRGSGGHGGDAAKTAESLLTGKYSTLFKALAGIGGLVGGKALQDHTQQNAIPPQLQQLLDLSMQRANAQTPLFNAANKGMYDMLPDFAKKG